MTSRKGKFSIDWRVIAGIAITLVWISTGVTYLLGIVGLDSFIHLPTGDIGSFLEGAFAPLAFLWLVIGHFMQQKEIAANTRTIHLQEESAHRQEAHAQRDSYFKLLNLVQDQLGGIAGFHYMSVCGPTGNGSISVDEFSNQRALASNGDHALFVRKMIGLAVENRRDTALLQDIFFGTTVRKRHSDNFTTTFGKLLNYANAVDTDDLISDALLNGSAAGILYRIIQHIEGKKGIDPLVGFPEPQAPLQEASV